MVIKQEGNSLSNRPHKHFKAQHFSVLCNQINLSFEPPSSILKLVFCHKSCSKHLSFEYLQHLKPLSGILPNQLPGGAT